MTKINDFINPKLPNEIAARTGEAIAQTFADLHFSGTEARNVEKAMRMNGGNLCPETVELVEELAKRAMAFAKDVRATLDQESRPSTDPKDFPIPADKIPPNVMEAAWAAMSANVPMSMSEGRTPLGGRENPDGSTDVLIAAHSFMTGPQPDSTKYVVTVNEQGLPTHLLLPSEAAPRPIETDPMANMTEW